MIKHLGINLKRSKVVLCFIYQNGIINEEKILKGLDDYMILDEEALG
jgi:hypothetical protein